MVEQLPALKLAFVDFLNPNAIVQKGFKLDFISGTKQSKYQGNLSVKKVTTIEKKSKVTGKYQVGAYKDSKGVEGLDAYHAGQKAVMKKFVNNYDSNTALATNALKVGHTIKGPNGIVSRSTKGIENPRQLLAMDTMELRRVYDDIPYSTLKELVELNKNVSRKEEKK
ncbi:hypothetical protein [Sporosarcina sp. SG10008]|uniref:hypothetical protein n=1 Tax=Sporosarcina sp. SG10008 TaxID=3373103 RepID=UPI0037DD3400